DPTPQFRERSESLLPDLEVRGAALDDVPVNSHQALESTKDRHLAQDEAQGVAAAESFGDTPREGPIDQEFVRRKLDRVNAQIRATRIPESQNPQIRAQASAALEEYGKGHYEASNRRLDAILRVLNELRE